MRDNHVNSDGEWLALAGNVKCFFNKKYDIIITILLTKNKLRRGYLLIGRKFMFLFA